MSDLLVVAKHSHRSGLARDAVVNTFAMHTEAAVSTPELDSIGFGIYSFYNNLHGAQVSAVGSYLSPSLERVGAPATYAIYDITGKLGYTLVDGKKKLTPHGSPIWQGAFPLVASSGASPMAAEVAVVVTLEAVGRDEALAEAADAG